MSVERLQFGPPPPAIALGHVDLGGRDAYALSDRGVFYLLSDSFFDLTGPEPVFVSRLVQQVTGGEGVSSAASFEVVFDPRFETVIIHGVRVHRDGKVRDAATPEAFELLRRELNLERAVYDGRLTAHMIIPDVRIGDQVETSFSIIGSNPVLKGRFSWNFRLQWSTHMALTRCRVIAPEHRVLEHRAYSGAPTPVEEVTDGVRTLTWSAADKPPHHHELDAPSGWVGYASVQVADRMTWVEVADLFRDAYGPPPTLPGDLEAEVGTLAAHADPATRVAEALRLVQDRIRYHSVGLGEGGFRPRPVETIWATRYGDCKDVSRLLSALLRRLDVGAAPALVHTWSGRMLDQTLPSPTVFNHCIVRVRLDERTLWLDPTFARQSGRLENIGQASHHWALPLVADATLEAMAPSPQIFSSEVEETWTFAPRVDTPARLDIKSVYRGPRADSMRRWRENDGPNALGRRLREDLEAVYGAMITRAPPEWTDDADANQLTVLESYDVERPFRWVDDEGQIVRFESNDDLIGPNLRTPETAQRREPIDVGTPRRVQTRRVLKFPVTVQVTPWDTVVDGPGMRGVSRFRWTGEKEAEHLLELAVRESTVPAARAGDYFAFARRMRSVNGVSITIPVRNGKLRRAEGAPEWVGWLVIVGIIACIVAYNFVRFA